ncbi:hypothetical protein [Halalkalibacter okhensis]|uniref:hypothetical protein n=1 Tax=Halalkalibacter okhensis TaxID=333138 RepID=UPI000B0A9C4B|nr:hypothetical protein [Halalkalibacter okhensis]
MTKELINAKEYLREEVKTHYYVLWEQFELCVDETETATTEEIVTVMYEKSVNSSLVPMYSRIIEKSSSIEDTLVQLKKECKGIFKETVLV